MWRSIAAAALTCASLVGVTAARGADPQPPASSAADPQAVVAGGAIRGRLLPDRGGAVFKGIPFAQPPVGALRWREPQPAAAWSGLREALESQPPCAQGSSGWNEKEAAASREDCLYLDVWTPEWPVRTRRPVMVWIHGGGNSGGAGGSDPLYEGTRIVRRGVVLVIVDYRLGVFGFFAHPELSRESPRQSSGNYGLLDQVAALQWVRDNVAALGGDPANVTVFGQSAGAMDVSALMASPPAQGLFHRVIAQSGSAVLPLPSLAEAESAGAKLAASVKAPPEAALPYLRGLPAAQLIAAARGGATANLDPWLLPRQPAEVFAAGAQSRVPLLIGSNAIEFASRGDAVELRRQIEQRYGPLATEALASYGLASSAAPAAADPLYGTASEQWGADTTFRCPGILQGRWQAEAGQPVWQYQFDRAIPPKPTVVHSSELPYVFDNLFAVGSQAGAYVEADRKLAAAVQAYWTNFARTGDPNGGGLPQWPRYDAAARPYLELTRQGDVTVARDQRGRFCDLFVASLRHAPAESR